VKYLLLIYYLEPQVSLNSLLPGVAASVLRTCRVTAVALPFNGYWIGGRT